MSWFYAERTTFVAATVLTVMALAGTLMILVLPRSFHYEAKDPISAVVIAIIVITLALSTIVVIDRMFVAWYRNKQPAALEKMLWLILLLAIPFGVLIYYWAMYRRLDARGQGEIFPAHK